MKKIISFLIFGCLCLCGFSINPIDPLAKAGEPVNIITAPSPVTTKECSDLYSLVPVDVIVTFTDCPYDCEVKNCTFNICIYDGTTLLGCQSFDPDTCQYTFEGLRAEEGHTLSSHLEPVLYCGHTYNNGYDQSPNPVPQGGGTVYISTTYCQ